MTYVIRLAGLVGQQLSGQPPAEGWIAGFDPDGARGLGIVNVTDDVDKAVHFDTFKEAWEFWRQQSRIYPRRPDGQPNRPLTAYNTEIQHHDRHDS